MYFNYILGWASFCVKCFRNFGRIKSLVQRRVASPDDETKFEQMYVCSDCGSTRKL